MSLSLELKFAALMYCLPRRRLIFLMTAPSLPLPFHSLFCPLFARLMNKFSLFKGGRLRNDSLKRHVGQPGRSSPIFIDVSPKLSKYPSLHNGLSKWRSPRRRQLISLHIADVAIVPQNESLHVPHLILHVQAESTYLQHQL
jgi:hypothetical protein